MKSFLLLGAAAAAIAVASLDDRLAAFAPDAVPEALADETYLLQLAGVDASCTIRRAAGSETGDAKLVVGDGCSDTLAGASLWRDNADGSVSFLSPSGRAVLEFAQGDGAAYETFRAGAPLATLVAAD
jgi:hypothetical protein